MDIAMTRSKFASVAKLRWAAGSWLPLDEGVLVVAFFNSNLRPRVSACDLLHRIGECPDYGRRRFGGKLWLVLPRNT